MVFKIKEDRLMGLYPFGSAGFLPGLGINMTSTLVQLSGIWLRVKLPMKSLTSSSKIDGRAS